MSLMGIETCLVYNCDKEALGYIDIFTHQHVIGRAYYCNHHLEVVRNYTAILTEQISKHQQPTEKTINLLGVPEDVVAHALISEALVLAYPVK
jgi:hypothetical protein